MDLQGYLDNRNITKYRLSKISGVPKTTIIDICSGKSSMQKCTARTVQQLAKALGCTMEFILSLDVAEDYDRESGLPKHKNYLERGLPAYDIISERR